MNPFWTTFLALTLWFAGTVGAYVGLRSRNQVMREIGGTYCLVCYVTTVLLVVLVYSRGVAGQ